LSMGNHSTLNMTPNMHGETLGIWGARSRIRRPLVLGRLSPVCSRLYSKSASHKTLLIILGTFKRFSLVGYGWRP